MKIRNLMMPLALLILLSGCTGGNVSSAAASSLPTSTVASTSSSKAGVKYAVSFALNYEGASAPSVVEVNAKSPVAKPADPTRAGYVFAGWFLDASAYSAYDFSQPVKKAFTLYAGWDVVGESKTKRYVFEAEYSPAILTIQGATYSGGTYGGGLLGEDYNGDFEASNGFYVHFLYLKDDNLSFELQSDAAAKATIYMRLSAEYNSFTIDSSLYTVKVNGTSIAYNSIAFDNVPKMGAGDYPFKDYLLGAEIPLVAGKNTIEMITTNERLLEGTATSTAPMVDCLKIKTSSTLTWPNESKSNLSLIG